MKENKKIKKIAVIILLAFTSSQALAEKSYAECKNTLSIDEVRAELSKKGYKDIGKIEYDDCIYEVIAVNPDGKKVEIMFEPSSKKIVGEESYSWN